MLNWTVPAAKGNQAIDDGSLAKTMGWLADNLRCALAKVSG